MTNPYQTPQSNFVPAPVPDDPAQYLAQAMGPERAQTLLELLKKHFIELKMRKLGPGSEWPDLNYPAVTPLSRGDIPPNYGLAREIEKALLLLPRRKGFRLEGRPEDSSSGIQPLYGESPLDSAGTVEVDRFVDMIKDGRYAAKRPRDI